MMITLGRRMRVVAVACFPLMVLSWCFGAACFVLAVVVRADFVDSPLWDCALAGMLGILVLAIIGLVIGMAGCGLGWLYDPAFREKF